MSSASKPQGLSLDPALRPHARTGGRLDRFRDVSGLRTVAQPAFLLEREVQAFRQAAEGQRRATERSVFLGEPGEFLATMRTVISHKHGPLRSSPTFEFEDIHTGHNECRHENRTRLIL
jgi:hypothetical protein